MAVVAVAAADGAVAAALLGLVRVPVLLVRSAMAGATLVSKGQAAAALMLLLRLRRVTLRRLSDSHRRSISTTGRGSTRAPTATAPTLLLTRGQQQAIPQAAMIICCRWWRIASCATICGGSCLWSRWDQNLSRRPLIRQRRRPMLVPLVLVLVLLRSLLPRHDAAGITAVAFSNDCKRRRLLR